MVREEVAGELPSQNTRPIPTLAAQRFIISGVMSPPNSYFLLYNGWAERIHHGCAREGPRQMATTVAAGALLFSQGLLSLAAYAQQADIAGSVLR
jgi:hypothetical protein